MSPAADKVPEIPVRISLKKGLAVEICFLKRYIPEILSNIMIWGLKYFQKRKKS